MIVATPLGPVAGRGVETPDGSVALFLGIPYAEAPGASARFRAAAPARAHRDVMDATSPAPVVPQDPDVFRAMLGMPADPWSEVGSLSANVWAPEGARDLPVLVWVHGGGYVGGSNSSPRTDGARLAAAEGVVVVALSYRLGVFGFLPAFRELGEGFEDASNLGILDLVTGLEWVRENVAAFGGDPALVTLFGQSAGAAAVATLLGMPRTAGLFRRAILQSGTAERARTPAQAADASARFLHAAGLTAATSRDLLAWPAERVLDAQRAFTEVVAAESVGLPLPYQPVIDGRSIPMLPVDAVRAGVGGDVDLIVGTNLDEGSFATTMGEASDAHRRAVHRGARDARPAERTRCRARRGGRALPRGTRRGTRPHAHAHREPRGVPIGRAIPPAQQSPARGPDHGISSHVFVPVHLAEPHRSGAGQLSHPRSAVRVPAARSPRERAVGRRRTPRTPEHRDEPRVVDVRGHR